MSQKLTKNLKSPVKGLKEKIKELEKDRDYYRNKYYAQQKETEKAEAIVESFNKMEAREMKARECSLHREVDNLKEIIRWLIKPSTAGGKRPEDFPRHFGGIRG